MIFKFIIRYCRSQYVAGVLALLSIVSSGLHNGWPSPYIPVLESGNYTFQISSETGSYLVVMPQIGEITGAVLILLIVDIVGRKSMIIASAVLSIIIWMVIGFASSPVLFFIFRFIAGISCTFSFEVVLMYLAEITEPKVRGVLVTLYATAVAVGDLIIYAIGAYLPLNTAAFVSTILPALYLVTYVWMPESPYLYIMHKKDEEARKSLQILRAREEVSEEFERISVAIKEQNENKTNFLDLFTVKNNRKALFIGLGLRAFSILAGIDVMRFYCKTTFEESSGFVSSNNGSIIYITLHAVFSGFSSYLVQFCERRWLSIVSLTGTGITLFVISVYLYLKECTDIDLDGYSYLPVVLLLCYVTVFSVGMQTAPILVLSEIFPTNVKATAFFCTTTFSNISVALTSKFFHWSMNTWGLYVPFFVFAICCGIGIIFFAYCVPETKGKTLEQIQMEICGDRSVPKRHKKEYKIVKPTEL